MYTQMTAPCEKPKEAMKPISIQTSRYSCRRVKKIVATRASRAGFPHLGADSGTTGAPTPESRVNTSLNDFASRMRAEEPVHWGSVSYCTPHTATVELHQFLRGPSGS